MNYIETTHDITQRLTKQLAKPQHAPHDKMSNRSQIEPVSPIAPPSDKISEANTKSLTSHRHERHRKDNGERMTSPRTTARTDQRHRPHHHRLTKQLANTTAPPHRTTHTDEIAPFPNTPGGAASVSTSYETRNDGQDEAERTHDETTTNRTNETNA